LRPGPPSHPEPRGNVPRPSPSLATASPDHRAFGATDSHARRPSCSTALYQPREVLMDAPLSAPSGCTASTDPSGVTKAGIRQPGE
jgi:hypothetical protein